MTPPHRKAIQEDDSTLTDDELKVLKKVAKDRLWWDGTLSRMKKIGIIAGAVFAGLAFLAMWWPWITHIVQFLIKDVPK